MKSIRSIDGIWNVLVDGNNLSKDYYDHCWDVAGDAAIYPRLSSQKSQNNSQRSTAWFKDVTFLSLSQFAKALVPMLVTLAGIVMDFMPEQL